MKFKQSRNLSLLATFLAFVITMLSAYTRTEEALLIHRFVTIALGLVIAAIALLAWKDRKKRRHPVVLATILLLLVILQSIVGMWAANMTLVPAMKMFHLLAGFITLTLTFSLSIRLAKADYPFRIRKDIVQKMMPWTIIGLVILTIQIILGLLTSTHQAAICSSVASFPICQGDWMSALNFKDAFQIWATDYEWGTLASDNRITLHVVHRFGAMVTLLYLGWLAWRLQKMRNYLLEDLGKIMSIILLLQVTLGIISVVFNFPLVVAVAHNGFAALLLLSMTAINFVFWAHKRHG